MEKLSFIFKFEAVFYFTYFTQNTSKSQHKTTNSNVKRSLVMLYSEKLI